jgi:hypothetical protein
MQPCCSGKTISTAYCVCVCSTQLSSMQCACTLQSSVTCQALQYFTTFSHKYQDLKKKSYRKHKMCVLIFSTTFVWNISQSKYWARYNQNVWWPLFLSDFNELEFSRQFFLKILNKFHEIPSRGTWPVPWGLAIHDEATSRFSQFCIRS